MVAVEWLFMFWRNTGVAQVKGRPGAGKSLRASPPAAALNPLPSNATTTLNFELRIGLKLRSKYRLLSYSP